MTCECPVAGYCPRYDREMVDRHWQICQGVILTPEKCETYREHWKHMPTGKPSPLLSGVGTELHRIFSALGIAKSDGCNCDEWIAKMNAWGPDGCEDHRDEILEHLKKSYAAINPSWAEKATIAAKALAMGIIINPLDPAGSLLNAAIRRSKKWAKLTPEQLSELRTKWEQTTLAKLAAGPIPIDQLGFDYDQHWLGNLLQSGQIAKITINGQTLYGLPANGDIMSEVG